MTLAILAATNAVGTLCTIFVPEAKRMTLKDSALRSQSLFERLMGGQVWGHICLPCFTATDPCRELDPAYRTHRGVRSGATSSRAGICCTLPIQRHVCVCHTVP